MKKTKLKILSTKVLSKEAIDKALMLDILIDELPFITTEPINTEELKKILKGFLQQNITAVFTSKNAVQAFDQIANAEVPWKIFCIGHSTKNLVSKIFGEEKISRKNYDGILFFSPSAVNSFFSLNKINEQIQIFAIGKTTADAIHQQINKDLIIAETPGEEDMIEKVISYFSTTKIA